MSIPAVAAVLRASSFPVVSTQGASAFERMTALVGTVHASDLDTELKAILDEAGTAVFPAGITTTEAAMLEILENRTQFVGELDTAVSRYFADGAAAGQGEVRLTITQAAIQALGAVSTAQIALGSLPAKAEVTRAYVLNLGTAMTGLITLTASIGTAGGSYIDTLAAATVFAANAANEGGVVTPVLSYTAASAILVQLVGGANFDQLSAGDNGLEAVVKYNL